MKGWKLDYRPALLALVNHSGQVEIEYDFLPTLKASALNPSCHGASLLLTAKHIGIGAGIKRLRTRTKAVRFQTETLPGVPTWSHDGILCTGETYKDKVKLTFARGAALPDPKGLFNAGLDGNVRRAIDLREGEKIDEKAFKALVRAAVALNKGPAAARGKKAKRA